MSGPGGRSSRRRGQARCGPARPRRRTGRSARAPARRADRCIPSRAGRSSSTRCSPPAGSSRRLRSTRGWTPGRRAGAATSPSDCCRSAWSRRESPLCGGDRNPPAPPPRTSSRPVLSRYVSAFIDSPVGSAAAPPMDSVPQPRRRVSGRAGGAPLPRNSATALAMLSCRY